MANNYTYIRRVIRIYKYFFLILLLSVSCDDSRYVPLNSPEGFNEIYRQPHYKRSHFARNNYVFPKPDREDQIKYWEQIETNNGYIKVLEDGWITISSIWKVRQLLYDEGIDLYIGEDFKYRIFINGLNQLEDSYDDPLMSTYSIYEWGVPVKKGQFLYLKSDNPNSFIKNLVVYFKPKEGKKSGGDTESKSHTDSNTRLPFIPSGGLGSQGEGN